MLERFRRVSLSASTLRGRTERAGGVDERRQQAEVERLERERPPSPVGEETLMRSVDGAMVAWVGGSWVEVKSRVVGRVEASEPNRKRTAGTEPKTGTEAEDGHRAEDGE